MLLLLCSSNNDDVDFVVVLDYEQELNKDLKDGEDAIKVKKADNEVFYLKAGKYQVVIEGNGESAEGELEVK